MKEGLKYLRRAVELAPRDIETLSSLGNALAENDQPALGEEYLRRVVALAPQNASAYYNLGNAVSNQNKAEQAEALYRKALALEPNHPQARCNLGLLLQRRGKFAEGLKELERGHELGTARPGWPFPSAKWVAAARQLVEMEKRLPEVLAGKARPARPEGWLQLARFVEKYTKQHLTAVRLYREAFAAKPAFADNLAASYRYNAACHAALAAAGKAEDARELSDSDRLRLRRQALTWLCADLALARRQLAAADEKQSKEIRDILKHWLDDADLAGLRDLGAMARLSGEERRACERMWQQLRGLLGER